MTKSDQIDVKGDGRVVLYKREGLKNPVWQARLRIPNSTGYKIVSTKTDDLRAAERFALNLYEELYIHVRSGGSIKSKTFRQVFDEWVRSATAVAPTRQGGSWDKTIERARTYAVEFFGSKRIEEITASDFSDYWVWRKSHYNRKPPSNGTLKRERTCLVPVFKYAVAKGYIGSVPDTNTPKAPTIRRSTFTVAEWRTITTKMRQWVKEGQKKSTGRDRFIAQQYFLILANTGMRVGELRGLKWGDLRTVQTDGGSRLVAYVRGKTGAREVVFQAGADEYVKRLYDMRVEELSEQAKTDADRKPKPTDLVICHPDGTAIQSMKKSFASLLAYAQIPPSRDGMDRTIYSLRHFYATQRLSHETSPFLLAKQMGTSVEMLEKFYGQTVTSSLAAEISKSKQKAADPTEKGYPFE